MKRRKFLKRAAITGFSVISVPYILPSGRLFAASGARRVDHVVLCLFAGGIRNLETVLQNQSNLMETMLTNVAGGFVPQTGIEDVLPPSPITGRLQDRGTLMKEFRFLTGPTGHYNAHLTAMTGRYSTQDLNIRANPDYPTVFEYYRKHNATSTMSALDAWWVSDSLGPYPALNYSKYEGYGALYGANFIQPTSFVNTETYNALGTPKQFTTGQQTTAANMRSFLDNNFSSQYNPQVAGITNAASDVDQVNAFISRLFGDAVAGGGDPLELQSWGFSNLLNGDVRNVYYAEKVIEEFTPELLVLNMTNTDVCHANFSGYCNNIRKIDWAVSHLWDSIQTNPVMMNNTVLIIAPEHGRNLAPNTLLDTYGRPAYDHTSDPTSREIFCLICGPSGVVNQSLEITSVYGESVDILPTIANLLGFDTAMPSGIVEGKVLTQALV